MKVLKLFFGGIVILILLFAIAYGLKVRLQIDLFEKFHLSDYPPFNLLIPDDVIDEPGPGYLKSETFDSDNPFGFWHTIYSGKKGAASRSSDPRGINGTNCLLVKCNDRTDWTISSGYFIKVNVGDKFHYEAKLKPGSPLGTAGISVASFGLDRKNVKYNFAKQEGDMRQTGAWQTISLDISIDDPDTGFIMPRLWGNMPGVVRYDDIIITYTKN